MATTFVLIALDQSLQVLRSPKETGRFYIIGVMLALAVTTNLTALFPGLALGVALTVLHAGPPLLERNWPRFRERLGLIFDRTVVPSTILATVVLIIPLLPAKANAFYVGNKTLRAAAESLFYPILWRPRNFLEHSPVHRYLEPAVISIAPWLPLLIILAAAVIVVRKRRVDAL